MVFVHRIEDIVWSSWHRKDFQGSLNRWSVDCTLELGTEDHHRILLCMYQELSGRDSHILSLVSFHRTELTGSILRHPTLHRLSGHSAQCPVDHSALQDPTVRPRFHHHFVSLPHTSHPLSRERIHSSRGGRQRHRSTSCQW